VRASVALVALALVASACGDGTSGGSLFPPSTDSTVAAADAYPEAIVEAYMEGCTPESGDEFCRCSINEFQERLDLTQFLALDADTLETDPLALDIVDVCLRQVGDATGPVTTDPEFTPITTIEEIVNVTVTDLEIYWAETMPVVWAIEYEPPAEVGPYFVSEGDTPRCGGPLLEDEYVGNAFYCGFDDTIQWDQEGLMAPLFEEYGDFTVALVLAHEWGHAIQIRYGFDERNSPTIISELQADCFAGAWTGRVAASESDVIRLEEGDLEEAMAGFLLIGDELGAAPGGLNAHGGSFDRLNAFFEGFNDGAAHCATYEDENPAIIFIPLVEGDDPFEGGDLPLADAPQILIDALEVFWGIAYPETFGSDWVPVSDYFGYFPSQGDLPRCGGRIEPLSFYPNNAFYCEPDDYVAWDDENLFPSLYTEIGDFALGLVLANQWGRAVLARRGMPTEGGAAQLQVDCMAGVWTSSMTLADNPMQLFLSAGDLEEGIAGFLTLSSTPGAEPSVGAFDRFEAFSDGFFDGIDACGLNS
jgi:predicted metalloprotease